jgi:serine/threonine protein kinase/Tol biopolymer transport system component
MTPERWREVERLYYATLERAAGERDAFLAEACGPDELLRDEVASLIAYRTKAVDFIEPPQGTSPLVAALRRLEEAAVPGRFVGRSFGAYDVQSLIAAGGMGEVYRAVDTRLNRTVAIKTLPAHLTADAARRERFEREARIVSSLNHPHICTLFDVGTADHHVQYLVMEYIDGETLQQRLRRGAVPLPLALEYAIQIVDALDKAHRRGVIHRDLKPGNVMLTKSGVKLLDFGLARQWSSSASIDESKSLTVAGTIMGTPQYTSPEQLEGLQGDARTDIFAFGALAYEMITGKAAFHGSSQVQLVGAILKDDPRPIAEIVPDVPIAFVRTVSRCLAKDPEDRWQTANDLLFELRTIASSSGSLDGPVSRANTVSRLAERAVWIAVIAATAVGAFLWTRSRDDRGRGPTVPAPLVRYSLFPAAGTTFHSGYESSFALSPDGRYLAYVASGANSTKQLWLQSLDREWQQAVAGTEGASTPFWSPDSEWVGFTADDSLKKVRVSSGLVQPIASHVSTPGGATWNAHDVIVFGSGQGGLLGVSARGGPVTRVTTPDAGGHFWPQFLSDGEHFIYSASIPGQIYLASLDGGTSRTLMKFSVRTSSLAHVAGYILFVQDAVLFARPFDEQRLEFSGDPVRLVEGIPVMGPGRAPFSVSAAGVLAYRSYPSGTPAVLRWFDREGRASVAVDTPAQYLGFSLSPDGRQVTFSRAAKNGGADVWIRDLAAGAETRLTFDGAAFTPQWSPDGARIAFSGPGENPPPKLFVKSVADAVAATRVGPLLKTANFSSGWSGDGRSIVSVRIDPINRTDLWVQGMQDEAAVRLPFNTPSNEMHGKVSPDNHWIAYQTDASGKNEVWIASFPSAAIRRQVSVGGGSAPEWGESSREIFYLSRDRRVMSVRLTAGETGLDAGSPSALFQVGNLIELDRQFPGTNAYAAATNGQRFLVAETAPDPSAPPISVVVNWTALLKR